MSLPTTHDLYAERYRQDYVAPDDVPRVFTPAPLADLQACMSSDPPTPAPSGEQAAPITLADALMRLQAAREQIALAESDLAAIAANLAGHN